MRAKCSTASGSLAARPSPGRARRASAQRPGVLHAEGEGAAPPPCARQRLAPVGRHEQRAQAAETVGGDEAERHQLGQRLFDLRRQQAAALDQLVEEGRALGADAFGDGLRARARLRRRRRGGESAAQSGAWRRASSVIGVLRTGADAALAALGRAVRGRSRAQATRPARQRSSSQAGS